MNPTPPRLHDDDLRLELQEYLTKDRAHFHFAFYGTRESATQLDVAGHVYRVQPVRCELELRERFAELADAPKVAWLVPFQGSVPHDLRHSFAKQGAVRTVGASAKLRRVFGVQLLEPGLDTSPLARWLVELPDDDLAPMKVNAQRLTSSAMWSAWFGAQTGIAGVSDLSLGQWLLRCARHADGAGFARRMRERDAGGAVLSAFEEYVTRLFGPLGAAVLRAWYAGEARQLLLYGIVSSALLESGDRGAAMWLSERVKRFGCGDSTSLGPLRDAAEQTLHELARTPSERDALSALLRAAEAESLVDHPEVRPELGRHRWLSLGFRVRLEQLGRALERALAAPSPESLQQAIEAEAALAQHHRYSEYEREADRARMAVRLVAFLQRAPALQHALSSGEIECMHQLARWYSEEGGYVDLARQVARSSDDTPFGRGVRAVVAQVDEFRRALDRRFARGLAVWLNAGTPAGHALPIQHGLAHTLRTALESAPDRRALVLLMDGMGWAECTALLRSAAESPGGIAPFAPLRLNSALWKAGASDTSMYGRPTLAAIPTVTKVSRSAFFEGALPAPGKEPSSNDDPKRFASHPVVSELNSGRPARLLLRAEGHNSDGHLSDEARTLIRDTHERVVGLVVNAIDASLKSDAQHVTQWRLNDVRSLPDIFDEAQRAGRIVLFASDHGHVRSGELLTTPKPETAFVVGGERWRGAARDESHGMLQEEVPGAPITFACNSVWTPPGASGVTVMSDERGRHALHPHVGEHGGVTLAEVVAPCLWLGAPDPDNEHTELETLALRVPDFWLLRPVAGARADAAVGAPTLAGVDAGARAAKTGSRSKRPLAAQWAPGSLAAALSDNELFRARTPNEQLRERTLRAVDFLAQRDGVASLQDLADAVGVHRYRVEGLLSQMQRALNVDGEPILEQPLDSKQARLRIDALRLQFEVSR